MRIRRLGRQVTAIFVIAAFALLDVSRYAPEGLASPAPQVTEQSGSSFSIPKELGKIDEVYLADQRTSAHAPSALRHPLSAKTIVFVQDAHDSLEAQENIAKLIDLLVERDGVRTVFEEGYEGPVPTDKFFGFIKDPKTKQKVSYFLLDQLRIGGAEYAHINRRSRLDRSPETGDQGNRAKASGRVSGLESQVSPPDFELIGVEDLKLYGENIRCYQDSSGNRKNIEEDLGELLSRITALADEYFPKELKTWMKRKELFGEGKLPLLNYLNELQAFYSKALQTRSSKKFAEKYPALALLLLAQTVRDPKLTPQLNALDSQVVFEEIARLEGSVSAAMLQNARDRDLFTYHKGLNLLKRLNRIELTQAEYEAAKEALGNLDTRKLADFIVSLTHRPLVLSKEWERHIKDAVRFYEVALQRDGALSIAMDKYFHSGNPTGAWQKAPGAQRATRNVKISDYRPETTDPRLITNEYLSPWERPGEGGELQSPVSSLQSPKLTGIEPAILVYGGFHANSIKEMLREKGISYVVISPRISGADKRHQDFYKQLMAEGHRSFEMPFLAARANKPPSIFYSAAVSGEDASAQSTLRAITSSVEAMGNNFDPQLIERDLAAGMAQTRSEIRVSGVNVSSSTDTPNIKREPAVKDLSNEIESKLGIDTHGKLTEFIGRMLGVIPTIHDFDSFVLSHRDPLNTLIQQYGVHLDNEEVEQILIRLLRWSFNLGFIDIDRLGWFNELNLDHPTIVITTRAQGGLGDITKIDLLIRGMKREFEKLKVSKPKFRVLIFDEDKEKMAILKNREYPDVDFIFLPSSDPIPENSSYLRDADVFISLDRAVTDEVRFDGKDAGDLSSALVYTTLGQYDRPAPRNPRYKRVKISEIPTGFQRDSAGFLISPFTEELYQRRLGLTEDQKLAEKEQLLARIIHEILPTQEVSQDQLAKAARSNWGLFYMHEQGMDYLNGITEYHRTHELDQSVTLFTLMGETNVWYKGTNEWEGLVSKIRAAGLPVETYDLSHDPKAISNIDFKKPVVRVINVGMHTLELYGHLMAASDLPVGVTGNESLFTALLLRKRFVYEVASWERTLFLNMLSDMRKVLGEGNIAASSVEGIRSGDISAGNSVKFWGGDPDLMEEFKQFGDSMPERELYPKVVRKILRSSAFTRFLDKREKRTDRAMAGKLHVQTVVRHAGLEGSGLDEYFPSFDVFRKASDHESGIIARVKEVLNDHFSQSQLKQDGEFLDVGASDGVIAEALMPHFKRGVAVEIDENVSKRLKSKEIHGLDVVTVPMQEYTPNHKFDVILVSHSLYYIEEKDRINQIIRMASWLKPGGKLILLYTVHGDSEKDLSKMKKALGVPSQAIDGKAIKDRLIAEGFEASLEILESAVTADLDGMLKIAPFVLKKSSLQATTIKSQIQEYIEGNLWDGTQRNYRLNIPQELLIINSRSDGHNKNVLDGPQSDRRSEMRDKEHVALYSFGNKDAIMSDENVPLRYSAYKYGSQEQSDYFLGMLQTEILKKFGAQITSNPGQWVLATTGYSMNKPSIVPLARKLSEKLGIEYVSVRAVRKNRISSKPLIYSELKTQEARDAVQEMYEYSLESDRSYEGKNVIFVDDFFASGSALKKINAILVNKYQMRLAGNFVIISIASMEARDPALEDEINSFLIRSKPLVEIAKLLNRKDTTVTRYAVAALFQMEMSKFRALVALLNDFYLSKLFIAVMQNYRDAVDVEKIQILNDRIKASSLNRETLISHLKQQKGGLVLLGGPSGAGKTTVADSLKESLGSPVLPVDFFPSDQGATKYGIKSHELFISHNNELVWAHISQLLQGKEVSVTSPYYYEHPFTQRINPPFNKPLIVDGLHAVNPNFTDGLPKSMSVTKVFVDAPKQIRFMRRLLTISGETNYAALMMWRNVLEAEEESMDLSRNNADFILVEPEDVAEMQRLIKDTAPVRDFLRDHLADLDERYDSRIVLKGILDDVESFIEVRGMGIDYILNKSLQDGADSIRSKRKGLKVGIVGGWKPSEEYVVADGEKLGRLIADYLRPIHGVAFTGGDSGVGADFYRGYCSLETSKDRFFVLLPTGFRPDEAYERMSPNSPSIERLGTRFSVRNIGTALVGDVFIAMNGGRGTMQEVTEALKRGKPVVALNYGGVGAILYQAKISGRIPQVLQANGIDENALKFIIPGDISNLSQALERARELMSDHAADVTALPNPSSILLSNIESVANQAAADMERDAKPEDQRLISEINDRIQENLQTLKSRADKGSFIVGNFEDLLHGQETLMEGLRKAPPVIVEFPGTYDPPHLVHVQRMLETLVGVSDTEEPRTYYAVFSPIGDNFGDSWKPNKSLFEHRYQMTKLISGIFSPQLSAIDVSRDSTKNEGVIDMLTPVLASDIKPLTDFYTVTGADNLEHLETYIARDLSAVPPGIRKHFAMLDDHEHPDVIARLSSTYPDNVVVVNTHANSNGARSTEIRTKKRFGILPIPMQKYIQKNSLYGAVAQERAQSRSEIRSSNLNTPSLKITAPAVVVIEKGQLMGFATIITAHRGGSPDNGNSQAISLESIKQSVARGVDAIEFDVQMTSDGTIVSSHAEKLTGKKISEMTLNEVRKIVPDLPTLEQIYDAAKGSNARFHIHIVWTRGKDSALIEKLSKFIQEKGIVKRSLAISFYPGDLLLMEQELPEMERCLVFLPTTLDAAVLEKDKDPQMLVRMAHEAHAQYVTWPRQVPAAEHLDMMQTLRNSGIKLDIGPPEGADVKTYMELGASILTVIDPSVFLEWRTRSVAKKTDHSLRSEVRVMEPAEREAVEEKLGTVANFLSAHEEYVPGANVPLKEQWKPVALDKLKFSKGEKILVMILGTWEDKVALEAAPLIRDLRARGCDMKVLTNGKYGNKPGFYFDAQGNRLPEAVHYRNVLEANGVPVDFVEPDSTNSGDNILFSKRIIDAAGYKPDTIIVMQNGLLQKRAGLSIVRQYFGNSDNEQKDKAKFDGAGTRLISYAPYIPVISSQSDENVLRDLEYALTEIKSLQDYPGKGYSIRTVIPEDVLDAAKLLEGLLAKIRQRVSLDAFQANYQSALAKIAEYPDPDGVAKVLRGMELKNGHYQGRVMEPGAFAMAHMIPPEQEIIQDPRKEFHEYLKGLQDIFGKDGEKIQAWESGPDTYHLALALFQDHEQLMDVPIPELTSEEKTGIKALVSDRLRTEPGPVNMLKVGYGVTADGGFVMFFWDKSGRVRAIQEFILSRTKALTGGKVGGRPKRGHVTLGRVFKLPYSEDAGVKKLQKEKVLAYVREKASQYKGEWERNLTDPAFHKAYSLSQVSIVHENEWLSLRNSKDQSADVIPLGRPVPFVKTLNPGEFGIGLQVQDDAFQPPEGRFRASKMHFNRLLNDKNITVQQRPGDTTTIRGKDDKKTSDELKQLWQEKHKEAVAAFMPNGNLGMNDSFVGIVDGQVFYYREDKQLEERAYDMLAMMKNGDVSVKSLRFDKKQNSILDESGENIADSIAVGVFGQHIVKGGKFFISGKSADQDVVRQFDDARHLFRFPMFVNARGGQTHHGFSDGTGELYKDPAKAARALAGEAVDLALSSLSSDEQRRLPEVFRFWGYENVGGWKNSGDLKPGEYLIKDGKMWIVFKMGVHPHSFFGLTQENKILIGAIPEGLTQYFGITLAELSSYLIKEHKIKDLFLWGNGKDNFLEFQNEQEKQTVTAQGAYGKGYSAFVVTQKEAIRSEARTTQDGGTREEDPAHRLLFPFDVPGTPTFYSEYETEEKAAYQEVLENRGLFHETRRSMLLSKMREKLWKPLLGELDLEGHPERMILDVGVGGGFELESLPEKFRENLVALDMNSRILHEVGRRYPGIGLVRRNWLQSYLPDASFDAVIGLDGLVLLFGGFTMEQFYMEMIRILKPGGSLNFFMSVRPIYEGDLYALFDPYALITDRNVDRGGSDAVAIEKFLDLHEEISRRYGLNILERFRDEESFRPDKGDETSRSFVYSLRLQKPRSELRNKKKSARESDEFLLAEDPNAGIFNRSEIRGTDEIWNSTIRMIRENLRKIVRFVAASDVLPARADVLMIPGNEDFQAIEAAAGISRRVDKVVVSGGSEGRMTSTLRAKAQKEYATIMPPHEGQMSEAAIIKEILILKGVPSEKIILEEAAKTTPENFKLSRALLERDNIPHRTIIYMTTPLQHARTNATFKKVFDAPDVQGISYVDPKTVPDIDAMSDEELLKMVDVLVSYAKEEASGKFNAVMGELEKLVAYANKKEPDIAKVAIPADVSRAAKNLKMLRDKLNSRVQERTLGKEHLSDLGQVKGRLRSKWADVRWIHNRVLRKGLIPEPVQEWTPEGFLWKGDSNAVGHHDQEKDMDPNPPQNPLLFENEKIPWFYGEFPVASQTLFTVSLNNEQARLVVAGDAQLRNESLLLIDRPVELVLTDEKANGALLTFHRESGLKGYVNSWGVGKFRRLHDHVVEDMPIFGLPLKKLERQVDGFEIQSLENYAASTLVYVGADDVKLAAVMARTARELLAAKIPHQVFLESGKVIFVLRDSDPRKLHEIETANFGGRYLTSLFVGGVVSYPQAINDKITLEKYQEIMKRVSPPSSVRDDIISNLRRSELRSSVMESRFEEQLKKPVYAVLDDIDGNLTQPQTSEVSDDVVDEIFNDLLAGKIRGLVSGRGEAIKLPVREKGANDFKEVVDRLLAKFRLLADDELKGKISNLLCFPEQSGYVYWNEWDPERQDFVRREEDIGLKYKLVSPEQYSQDYWQGLCRLIMHELRRQGKAGLVGIEEDTKRYVLTLLTNNLDETGHHLSEEALALRSSQLAEDVRKILAQDSRYAHLEAFGSSKAVDIAIPGLDKILAIRYIREKFSLPGEGAIATFDDSAALGGNGYNFTNKTHGYSTGKYDPASAQQVALPVIFQDAMGNQARRKAYERLQFLPVRGQLLEEDFDQRYKNENPQSRGFYEESPTHTYGHYRRLYDGIAGLFGVDKSIDHERCDEGKGLLQVLYAQENRDELIKAAIEQLKTNFTFVASGAHRYAALALAIKNQFLSRNIFDPSVVDSLSPLNEGFTYLKQVHPFYASAGVYPVPRPETLPELKLDLPVSKINYRFLDIGSAPKVHGAPTLNLLNDMFTKDSVFRGKQFKILGTDILFPFFEERNDRVLMRERKGFSEKIDDVSPVTYYHADRKDAQGKLSADVMSEDFNKGDMNGKYDFIAITMALHHLVKSKDDGEIYGEFPLAEVPLVNADKTRSAFKSKYLMAKTQVRVVTRLLNALEDHGVLFLNLFSSTGDKTKEAWGSRYEMYWRDIFIDRSNADTIILIQREGDRFVIHEQVIPFRPNNQKEDSEDFLLNGKTTFYGKQKIADLYPGISIGDANYMKVRDLFRRADILVYWYQSLDRSRWGSVGRAALAMKPGATLTQVLKTYMEYVPGKESLKQEILEDATKLEAQFKTPIRAEFRVANAGAFSQDRADQIVRDIRSITQPVTVFVDAQDFPSLSLAQKQEYLLVALSNKALRVVVYNYNERGQVQDKELDALLKFERVTSTGMDLAGAQIRFDRPNASALHLSKQMLPSPELVQRLRKKVFFFKTQGQTGGTLAAALLWAWSGGEDARLREINKGRDGFWVVAETLVNALQRSYDTNLVFASAA